MYDDIISKMTYEIIFDFDHFGKCFWNATEILTGAFLTYWGYKIGVWFLKRCAEY